MRLIRLAVLFSAGSFAAAAAGEARLRLAPGESAMITLTETVSAGYSWRAALQGDAVELLDAGSQPTAAMPGAPSTHRWEVRARHAGRAAITFDYRLPWENKRPVETRRYKVVVEPR